MNEVTIQGHIQSRTETGDLYYNIEMQKKIVFVRHFFEVTGCFEPVVKPLFHIIKYDETFGKVKVRTIEINIVSLLDI